jgi:hypothetical protein
MTTSRGAVTPKATLAATRFAARKPAPISIAGTATVAACAGPGTSWAGTSRAEASEAGARADAGLTE